MICIYHNGFILLYILRNGLMYYVYAMVSNGLACLPKISGPALDKRCHGKILRKDITERSSGLSGRNSAWK